MRQICVRAYEKSLPAVRQAMIKKGLMLNSHMMDAWSSVDIEDPNPLTLASVLNYRERALV